MSQLEDYKREIARLKAEQEVRDDMNRYAAEEARAKEELFRLKHRRLTNYAGKAKGLISSIGTKIAESGKGKKPIRRRPARRIYSRNVRHRTIKPKRRTRRVQSNNPFGFSGGKVPGFNFRF
jgi:hypothetical protein